MPDGCFPSIKQHILIGVGLQQGEQISNGFTTTNRSVMFIDQVDNRLHVVRCVSLARTCTAHPKVQNSPNNRLNLS